MPRTPEEVAEMIDRAVAILESRKTQQPDLKYEDGVLAALNWIMGGTEDEPVDKE